MSDRTRAGAAGGLAAATSLALAELMAGIVTSVPSLVEAVGDFVIDSVPPTVKDWAIDTFGVYDKPVLIAGIVVVTVGLGFLVGILSRTAFWRAVVAFGAFGALGAAAALVNDAFPPGAVIGALVAVAGGLGALAFLYRRSARTATAEEERRHDADRRAFLTGVGAVVVVAMVSAGAGRMLMQRARRVVAGRETVVLPTAAEAVAAPDPSTMLEVADVTPLVTPNAEFYRIDTALSVPRVDLSEWTLEIHGMVDRPYELTFDQLLNMPMVERYVTLSCVSNDVGGGLVGNAKWLGVPLGEILRRAGVQDGATQVVARAVDGFTVGFPTDAVFDGRDALLAVGMNDEPLPFDHGFPARLVVAGLYGYVSATKWLSDIELTTWDSFDAYWVPRGWSKEGPIKTQSRIDTPRQGATVGLTERAIAGVAWAPNIGIQRVEIQIDDEPWVEAELADALNEDTWRQWMFRWTPNEGQHRVRVRATDADGNTQTEEENPPAPDGATGWHTIQVTAQA